MFEPDSEEFLALLNLVTAGVDVEVRPDEANVLITDDDCEYTLCVISSNVLFSLFELCNRYEQFQAHSLRKHCTLLLRMIVQFLSVLILEWR